MSAKLPSPAARSLSPSPSPSPSPSREDALHLLRFAASFLWADLEIVESERAFLTRLAEELALPHAEPEVTTLLSRPPPPDEVDPSRVRPALADRVRDVALRAIAADGRVADPEMDLFDVLDALLPRAELAA